MKTDLHKMLEEAANDFADKHGFRVPYDGSNNFYDEVDVKASKDGFLAGAEYGYKEAIEVAKEWLTKYADNYYNSSNQADCCFYDVESMVNDFETNLNKLLEEKK